uniref:Bifunctional coenzyme A synthase n=1 Tax=Hirondellea gigas TaxID=1518452 RepID=A0A2P2I061_9CRUS
MTGLLVLTLPYRQLTGLLPQVMRGACEQVNKVLYVHLDPAIAAATSSTIPATSSTTSTPQYNAHLSLHQASNLIKSIYSKSSSLASSLDVRVVLSGFKGGSEIPVATNYAIEKVMIDCYAKENIPMLRSRYKNYLNGSDPIVLLKENECQDTRDDSETTDSDVGSDKIANTKIYKNIVAGGTFDHIHIGHKILITEGLLRCTNKFTIGVADGPLLAKKTLTELIEPVGVRIKKLRSLLVDIDPSVEYCLEPIYEPLGPSGSDPDMEMIIVSQESLKGGNYVNSARVERKLNALDVVVIELVEDIHRSDTEEEKVSSSSTRRRVLGTRIREPDLTNKPEFPPYIIGLTGGSASGKSSIAKRLSEKGVTVIDCDKLGHRAYRKGTNCYHKLVSTYGVGILKEDEEINRKALGAQVFGDAEKLSQLNKLVWPEIAKQVHEEVEAAKKAGAEVVVLDAAVLLEADWDHMCHEVWVCMLPKTEAVERICGRDGCSREQAETRLSKQMSDRDRLLRCHVPLCSLWDYDTTARQCYTALDTVISDIKTIQASLKNTL